MTPNKNLKIILLGAQFGIGNMGVGALTAGTIKCILSRFAEAEILLLDYGYEKQKFHFKFQNRTVPIQLLNMRFSKKLYLKNNIALLLLLSLVARLIPFKNIRKYIITKNACLNHVYEADLVTSIAGGDSFSDIYGLRRFFYVVLPQLLVLLIGKNLILLPQTLGPFKGMLPRAIAGYIFRRAQMIYSRDYTGLDLSKDLVASKNSVENIKFCFDVGFVLDPEKPNKLDLCGYLEKRKEEAYTVGLNVSGLLYIGGYTQNNMFGLKIDYRELVYHLIDFLIEKKEANLILVPHVFGARDGSESDSIYCEKIYKALKTKYNGKLFLARGSYNQNEIKYIIGLCDFFIGSRMHACIAALSQNIPAVAIAYSRKFYGVMQTIGVESLVVDPRRIGQEEILNIVDRTYERRDLLRQQLEQKMPQVKNTVLNLFVDIENFNKRSNHE